MGSVFTDTSLKGQEFPITYFQDMAAPKKAFCTQCGAELAGNAAFCSACGSRRANAPVAPALVAASAPVAAPAPVYAPAYAPVPTPVAAPVSAPAPTAPMETPFKFPILAVIFMGLAALYSLISQFISPYGWRWNDLLDLSFYALAVVGLATCRKKKNIMLAISFLASAGISLIVFLLNISSLGGYSFGGASFRYTAWIIVYANLFSNLISVAAYVMIGISYLAAKPGMRVLKMIGAIANMAMGFLYVVLVMCYYDFYFSTVADLLFATVLPMVAVILYTPFKKN